MNELKSNAKGNKILSHDALLSQCFQYTWNKYPQTRRLCFHVMNESKPIPSNLLIQLLMQFCKFIGHFVTAQTITAFANRQLFDKEHQIRMAQNKAIGIVPGVFDLLFYWKGAMYGFDIKIGADRLSDSQKEFMAAVMHHKGECYEIRSFEQFKEIFDLILSTTT